MRPSPLCGYLRQAPRLRPDHSRVSRPSWIPVRYASSRRCPFALHSCPIQWGQLGTRGTPHKHWVYMFPVIGDTVGTTGDKPQELPPMNPAQAVHAAPCPHLSPVCPQRPGTVQPAWMLVSPLSPLVPALLKWVASVPRSRASFVTRPHLAGEHEYPRRAHVGQSRFLSCPAIITR